MKILNKLGVYSREDVKSVVKYYLETTYSKRIVKEYLGRKSLSDQIALSAIDELDKGSDLANVANLDNIIDKILEN